MCSRTDLSDLTRSCDDTGMIWECPSKKRVYVHGDEDQLFLVYMSIQMDKIQLTRRDHQRQVTLRPPCQHFEGSHRFGSQPCHDQQVLWIFHRRLPLIQRHG